MNKETIIAKYINSVERIVAAFIVNREPKEEDVYTVTSKTKEFTDALRELYLSNDENKEGKYKVIYKSIVNANLYINKENFEGSTLGTYWSVIITSLEIASIHISELYFKETANFYPFPKDDLTPLETETKTDKPKAPVIALFCSVLNDAGIIRKIETESVQTYCKRVCDVFKLTYKIRIAKAFYNSDNKANKDKIKNLILPLIDLETSKSVSDYLDNKQPIKQKLFG